MPMLMDADCCWKSDVATDLGPTSGISFLGSPGYSYTDGAAMGIGYLVAMAASVRRRTRACALKARAADKSTHLWRPALLAMLGRTAHTKWFPRSCQHLGEQTAPFLRSKSFMLSHAHFDCFTVAKAPISAHVIIPFYHRLGLTTVYSNFDVINGPALVHSELQPTPTPTLSLSVFRGLRIGHAHGELIGAWNSDAVTKIWGPFQVRIP